MTSSFLPPLVQRLKLAIEEATVLEAFSPLAGRLFGEGCLLEGLAAWRLFPSRRGGFTVSYRFKTSGGRLGQDDRSLPYDLSTRIDVEQPPAGGAAEHAAALAAGAFQLQDDPRLNQLDGILGGLGVPRWFHHPYQSPELISYRPLSRATVRFRNQEDEGLYLRASASRGRFERGARLAGIAAERFVQPSGRRGLFPRLLDTLPELRATLIEECGGTLMHHCLTDLGGTDMESLADALISLFRGEIRELGTHNALDEAEATAWMLRRAAVARGDVLPDIDFELARLFEASALIESPAPVPLHRDLHDKQILLDGAGGVVLLDSDTLSAGDPALDLANLTVHLELRALQGLLDPNAARALAHQLLWACAGAGLRPSRHRMNYYQACTWLRLAGVYALRSSGAGLISTLLRRGSEELDSLQAGPAAPAAQEKKELR